MSLTLFNCFAFFLAISIKLSAGIVRLFEQRGLQRRLRSDLLETSADFRHGVEPALAQSGNALCGETYAADYPS